MGRDLEKSNCRRWSNTEQYNFDAGDWGATGALQHVQIS
jgi:hypothetical protein